MKHDIDDDHRRAIQFTRETHAHIDRYVAERGLPTMEGAYVGDAGVIAFACGELVDRGTPTWDAFDDFVASLSRTGFGEIARSLVSAVVPFRSWLDEKRLPDAPTTINRSERRWRARVERRARRR